MYLEFKAQGIEDLKYWGANDPAKAKMVLALLDAIILDPDGKELSPKLLKNELAGWYSLPIDAKNRLVFKRESDRIVVAQTRFHSD